MFHIAHILSLAVTAAHVADVTSSFPILKPMSVVELGSGWAANTVNTVVFRHHGVVTRGDYQFTGYYESDTRMVLARRDLRDNSLVRHVIEGKYRTTDAHNCISLGIDRDGYLHVSYDHHGDPLRYRRSLKPLDVEGWSDPLPMTGNKEDHLTYPYFLMAPAGPDDKEGKGALLFLHRNGGASNGEMCLKQYDPVTRIWSDINIAFIKGTGQAPWTCNAYWNHPAFDSRGRLQLSWVWRVNQGSPAKPLSNYNMSYACSTDLGKTWQTTRGDEYPLPITPVNCETVWAIPPGAKLFNQCTSAVDSNDRLHIAYGAADPDGIPQVQHLWFDGRIWRCEAVTHRTEDYNYLDGKSHRLSRPEIVLDSRDRVYLIYVADTSGYRMAVQRLDPPDYRPSGKGWILWEERVDYAEPIIDRIRFSRDGILSMLIQKNAHWDNTNPANYPPQMVRLIDWDLD